MTDILETQPEDLVMLEMDFETFKKRVYDMARLRFEKLASGYVMTLPTGEVVNAAHGRDNIFDLLEETTDIINITGLLFERLKRNEYLSPNHFLLFGDAYAAIEDLMLVLWKFDTSLSEEYRKETTKRDITRDEVKL